YSTADVGAGASDEARRSDQRVELPASVVAATGGPAADALHRLRDAARSAVAQHYSVGHCLVEFTLFSEMRPGDRHPMHADAEQELPDGRWVPNHTAWRTYVATLYLNAAGADFGGGTLRLPAIDREVVPAAGLLVGFPSGRPYVHEVTPVESGTRL